MANWKIGRRHIESRSIYRWLYIDFNSFFASVEQQLDPNLRGKPVAVMSVPSDATCVIAASYEAKAFGVKTGVPIYEAKRMCPGLKCVLARYDSYSEFHENILIEIERHLPISRVCSIDEVACELMDNENSISRATAIAKKIKGGLASNVGAFVKCSIGIAPNCYLAKIATDMQKPDGLTFIGLEDLPQKLYQLDLRDLPGVGANMELKLRKQGICDLRALCQLDLQQIRKVWGGVLGEKMWYHLQGIHIDEPKTKRSSLSHSRVMAPELRGFAQARMVATDLALKCTGRLRRENLAASCIEFLCHMESGEVFDAHRKCNPASDSFTFLRLLDQMWQEMTNLHLQKKIKKIAIVLSNFSDYKELQLDLFAKEGDHKHKANRMSFALDAIHKRYGEHSITLGGVRKSSS